MERMKRVRRSPSCASKDANWPFNIPMLLSNPLMSVAIVSIVLWCWPISVSRRTIFSNRVSTSFCLTFISSSCSLISFCNFWFCCCKPLISSVVTYPGDFAPRFAPCALRGFNLPCKGCLAGTWAGCWPFTGVGWCPFAGTAWCPFTGIGCCPFTGSWCPLAGTCCPFIGVGCVFTDWWAPFAGACFCSLTPEGLACMGWVTAVFCCTLCFLVCCA